MKYPVLFACLLSAILFSSCRKQVTNTGPVYSGKVIKNMCGNVVVQFTDGTQLGEANWNDDGKTYKNVFTVANPCTWNPGNDTSENIRFRFVGPVPQPCAQCLIYVAVPDKEYHIVLEK